MAMGISHTTGNRLHASGNQKNHSWTSLLLSKCFEIKETTDKTYVHYTNVKLVQLILQKRFVGI